VDFLHPSITENIILKLKSRFFDEINRPYILDWVEKFLGLSSFSTDGVAKSLSDILNQLKYGKSRLTSTDEERINKIVNVLTNGGID
jgi:hypothetical protein